MNKSIEKNRKTFNSQVVNRVAEKIGVTPRFVRQALNGERQSETAETICKEYKRILKQVNEALNQ